MATLIPTLSSCACRMTSGEKRFAQRLHGLLDGQTLCWYDVAFGAKHQHPDFLLLDPRHGLLVMELREWKIEQLVSIGQVGMRVMQAGSHQDLGNPLTQARQYAAGIAQALMQDADLRAPSSCGESLSNPGHAARSALLCGLGYGLVLCNITRQELNAASFSEAWPAARVICKDEMSDSVSRETFTQKLWRMTHDKVAAELRHDALSAQHIDRIRYHLFPELRIQQGALFIANQAPGTEPARPLSVMDLSQETLARSLGDGHRVVHGVAGSGKTMILAYRCTQMAKRADKPVLVLCYNDSLAAKLAQLIHDPSLRGRIIVRHFHGWCLDQLRLHRIAQPADGPGLPGRLVRAVHQAVAQQCIPTAQYSAVLIDEGHDFEPQWFKLLAQMVDPASNSLLLLYDDAQAIYGKKRSRDFSFAKVGIQARGRTTILRVNYRNSSEVLDYAYGFARQTLTPEENTDDDDAVPFITPHSHGRRGMTPQLTQCVSLEAEARHIAQQLQTLHAQGMGWRDMAVLYPTLFVGEALAEQLQTHAIPFDWLQHTRLNPASERVKLMTLHNSKGLEFPVVAIAGLGFMPYQDDEASEDTRLLYIGMTRAVERLILTAHQNSAFVKQLLALQSAASPALNAL